MEELDVEDQFSELHSRWVTTKEKKERLKNEGMFRPSFEQAFRLVASLILRLFSFSPRKRV